MKLRGALRNVIRCFSVTNTESREVKETEQSERYPSYISEKIETDLHHAQHISLGSVSDTSESGSSEKSEVNPITLSFADRQLVIATLHTAIEVVRQRLVVLDQTAPLRILQSLGRCRKFVWSVERLFIDPVCLESMFCANLAISASTLFEAWDTSHNGTRLRFPDCSTMENIRILHENLKSNLSLFELAIKGVVVRPFTEQQKLDFLYPALASFFEPTIFHIVRLIRPLRPQDLSTFLHEISYFSFLPSDRALAAVDTAPPPLLSLASCDGSAIFLHSALLSPANAPRARLTIERELMNALSRWRTRDPRLFPAEANPLLRAAGPPPRLVCAGDLYVERVHGRPAPEWSVFALAPAVDPP